MNIPNNIEDGIEEDLVGERPDGRETPITIEEVKKGLDKMKNGKAPGDDLIPAEILKNIGGKGLEWITRFFNRCWDEGRTPENWT